MPSGVAALFIARRTTLRGQMSEAAVLEAPADATTDTKAATVVETKGDAPEKAVATDNDTQVQTDTGADDNPDNSDDEPDHEAELERERREAERESIRAEERQKLADEARVEREKAAETAKKARTKTARKDAFDSMTALVGGTDKLLSYYDPATDTTTRADGKAFTDVIDALGLHVEEAVEDQVREKWRFGIERSLPDEASHKAFADWLSEGEKPIHEVINYLAEQKAAKTEWASKLTLEAAVAASPAAKKELAEIKKAEFEEGRKQGQKDRGKNPDARERGAGSTMPASRQEAEEQFAASNKDSAAISRLRAARARFAT